MTDLKRTNPAGGRGSNKARTFGNGPQSNLTPDSRPSAKPPSRPFVDPLSLLLSRLDNVRQCGTGHRADCPTGHKSRGTLAVTVGDDGRLLLHCFAGCGAAEVVERLGLSLADLFPDKIKDQSPLAKRERRDAWQQAGWAAALAVLATESTVLVIAANDLAAGKRLSEQGHTRLWTAYERIQSAKGALS